MSSHLEKLGKIEVERPGCCLFKAPIVKKMFGIQNFREECVWHRFKKIYVHL